MIIIEDKLISDEVVKKQFVCDLESCKGGCCEDGDAGAPLEENEKRIIDQLFDTVKGDLSEASLEEINRKGRYVYNEEFGWVTPTLGNDEGICVYALREKNGQIRCSFEKAYYEGRAAWKKPISCHLYPITITEKRPQGEYELVNYEARPKLCSPACVLGKKLEVPVYQFLKEALVRKYGEDFYGALHQVAEKMNMKKPAKK